MGVTRVPNSHRSVHTCGVLAIQENSDYCSSFWRYLVRGEEARHVTIGEQQGQHPSFLPPLPLPLPSNDMPQRKIHDVSTLSRVVVGIEYCTAGSPKFQVRCKNRFWR